MKPLPAEPVRSRGQRRAVLAAAPREADRAQYSSSMAAFQASRPEHSERSSHGYMGSRALLLTAVAELRRMQAAVTAALEAAQALLETYPGEHDDDRDRGPGYCACGRWADLCGARAAVERGEDGWLAEDGTWHTLTDAQMAAST